MVGMSRTLDEYVQCPRWPAPHYVTMMNKGDKGLLLQNLQPPERGREYQHGVVPGEPRAEAGGSLTPNVRTPWNLLLEESAGNQKGGACARQREDPGQGQLSEEKEFTMNTPVQESMMAHCPLL